MRKIIYSYILQEELGFGWLDKYSSNDRAFLEELQKVYRHKFPDTRYRIVRVI